MSYHQQRPPPSPNPSQTQPSPAALPLESDLYNIIPIHNLLAEHPSLKFPEVQAITTTLQAVGDLRKLLHNQWASHMDLLDWFALFFGFQSNNVRNQCEHLVLHLANAQMRLSPLRDNIGTLDAAILRKILFHEHS